MATAFVRLRMFWGALDIEAAQSTTPGYTPTQIVSGGDSAKVASGIGVRRATLEYDRKTINTALDPAYVHFDFLNTTGGSPDDTWTTADYTTLETALQTFATAYAPNLWSGFKMDRIIWHRVGSGVGKPNPAERVFTLTTPISGSASGVGGMQQTACSITFRTGVRTSWGRTYMPFSLGMNSNFCYIGSTTADNICTAAQTLVTAAATADFHLVVVSKPLSSSLNVEQLEVDDVLDVIRRRRPKKSSYRKILP